MSEVSPPRFSVSVFFPAYNDGGTIPSMVMSAIQTLRTLSDNYEVIVVNDGSRDHTAELLEELRGKYACLRVITHAENRGYGAALRTGIAAATKEWIFYTDGDAQYDVREMTKLFSLVTPSVDVVNGYKMGRSDPPYRAILGWLYKKTSRFLFGIQIRDIDCDFRLMRRKIFDQIALESSSGTICVELVKKIQDAGFRFVEVPVHHYYRSYGRSQFFTVPRLLKTARDLARLWFMLVWRTRFSARTEPALSTSPAKESDPRDARLMKAPPH